MDETEKTIRLRLLQHQSRRKIRRLYQSFPQRIHVWVAKNVIQHGYHFFLKEKKIYDPYIHNVPYKRDEVFKKCSVMAYRSFPNVFLHPAVSAATGKTACASLRCWYNPCPFPNAPRLCPDGTIDRRVRYHGWLLVLARSAI